MIAGMTRVNPDGTHRIHLNASQTLRMEMFDGQPEIFGSIVERLAEYEKLCLEPEEAFKRLKAAGVLPESALRAERERQLKKIKRAGL